jgi:hypothetical protein
MSEAEKSIIPLGARGLQLTTFDELFRFSEFVIKAGFTPKGLETKEKVFLALQYGMELGLSPMITLQNSMVVNNRPAIYGELVIGQLQTHPHFQDMTTEYSGEGEDFECKVTLVRKGMTPSVGTFSVRDAIDADLLNNPSKKDTWGKYKKRMLFWRAFSRAKVIFSDVLKGVRLPHEIDDETIGLGFENARNVTTAPAAPEIGGPVDDQRQAVRKEIQKARETVKNGGAKEPAAAEAKIEKTSLGGKPETGTPARGQRQDQARESTSPFDDDSSPDPIPLEVVRARLKAGDISELALLKILARNKVIEPAAIDRGLDAVPQHLIQAALNDWDEVMAQIVATPR